MAPHKRQRIVDQHVITGCLAFPGVSENALYKILDKVNAISGSSARFRNIIAAGVKRFKQQFTFERALQCEDGGEMALVIAHPHLLVELFASHSSDYAGYVASALAKHDRLTPIIYHDECTPGDVLQPDPAKKTTLFYMNFVELGAALRLESTWLPVAMCLHGDARNIKGGLSAITSEILLALQPPSSQLYQGIAIKLNGVPVLLRCNTSKFFAIYDESAQKHTNENKGASGLKPCLTCKNILKKGSNLADRDDYFLEISSCEVGKFQSSSDAEIFEAVDSLLLAHGRVSEKRLEQMETELGFNYEPDGLLANPVARSVLPPSRNLNDGMHCYFSNGVASWEVARYTQALNSIGVNKKDIQTICGEISWCRPASFQHRSPAHIRQLFNEKRFTPDNYKGMASDVIQIMPLLEFVAETVVPPDKIRAETASFLALCDACRELARVKNNTSAPDAAVLQQLQVEHQRLFVIAYGKDACKPKHHLRFHLPTQINRHGFYVDCFPMEEKHKFFKSLVANRLGSLVRKPQAFQVAGLSRLVMHQCERLANSDGLHTGLLGTVSVDKQMLGVCSQRLSILFMCCLARLVLRTARRDYCVQDIPCEDSL